MIVEIPDQLCSSRLHLLVRGMNAASINPVIGCHRLAALQQRSVAGICSITVNPIAGPANTVPATMGLLQVDKLPDARPVVVSPIAPSEMLPPAKAGAVRNVHVTPTGPAVVEEVGPQPEGSPEEAKSLAEVAMVLSNSNIEPVPSAPTPGFGPTLGHVGLGW